MGWISVDEQLPEMGVKVIAFCIDDEQRIVWYSKSWLRGEGWYDGYTWRRLPKARVTHWQPLPAPPMSERSAGE